MLRQDDIPVSDASAQTRQTGVLRPSSDNFPNLNDAAGLGGKKRKRDGGTMEDLLKDSFLVRPYPSTGFVKSRTLQPLILLPRSYLPLSYLDMAPSANALPQSRLFETHVKILELEERMGSQPMVLIARLDDGGRTLYAVEREDQGLYVLCQLGSWVNIQQLKTRAVVSNQQLPTTIERGLEQTTTLIPAAASKYSTKKRLAIEALQSMVKRPSTGLLTEPQSIPSEPQSMLDSQLEDQATSVPVLDDVTQPTAAEIFENVRNQYFEALYLSKASLAYFAKGPLSRARAAFHLDYDSTLEMTEYIAFLESLIMSTTLIDKKYRDGLPGCVSLIDIEDHSADDANQITEKTKRRRNSKKMKPGKNGLYPPENALIRRWWTNHANEAESGAPGISKEEITNNRIAQLRIRETQLQMIIILEVLALQPLTSVSEDIGEDLPAAVPRDVASEDKKNPVKSKKLDHQLLLIDVHIDRLSIWQSIALEATKTPLGDLQSASNTSLPKHTDNILRDFCIEVIAPFFSARLPDRCAVINRKLGGPVVRSPPKPRLCKSASFSGVASRPGAATKRPVPVKPLRNLKRVLTDERERCSVSRGPSRAILMKRSATAPIVPGLKREVSEVPSLSSMLFSDILPLQANRGGVLNSKRFSQREVDLSSLVPEVSSKAKKQAKVEAELRDAISALKKPNRELAGKDLVETAEKRAASTFHSRKSKKPVRNPLFQGVQISATPKANRQKDMWSTMADEEGCAAIPPSSMCTVLQSAAQPSREGLRRNPLFASIQATPTRNSVPDVSQLARSVQNVGAVDCGRCPASSPLQPCRSSAKLFAVIPESAVKRKSDYLLRQGIEESPVKKRTEATVWHSHPYEPVSGSDKENAREGRREIVNEGLRQRAGTKQEDSIYKSLGWDDADDIDDLA